MWSFSITRLVPPSFLFAQPWNTLDVRCLSIANQFRFSVVAAEFVSSIYVGVSLAKLKKINNHSMIKMISGIQNYVYYHLKKNEEIWFGR